MSEWTPVKPPVLSPSSIGTFNQCPLKFKYEKIDKRYGPGSLETVRGSFVHEILEYLFKRPAEERTLETAKAVAKDRWDNGVNKYSKQTWEQQARKAGVTDFNQFKWTSWHMVEGYFKMEDPTVINPIGLERWVDGPIIRDIRVRGIIDRLIEEDGKLIIQDYKTGKTPKDKRWEEDRIFPLMIYADLLEAETKQEVGRMELLYVGSSTLITYEPTADNREAMYAKVTNTWDELVGACETGDFPPKKSKLCDWCDFQDECPAWS